MNDAWGREILGRRGGVDTQGVYTSSGSIVLADLSLPAAGGATVTSDIFLFVAPDTRMHRVFVLFNEKQRGGGSMTLQLIQNLDDGAVLELTDLEPIPQADTEVTELAIQSATLSPEHPVFLRLSAAVDGSATTPWWANTTSLHYSIHFLN